MIKHCEECGAVFSPARERVRFCSRQCSSRYSARYAIEKMKKEGKKKTCKLCGNEYIANSTNQKYCSDCGKSLKTNQGYKYSRNAGLEPAAERKKTESKNDASARWAKMSWKEISAECARLHISYGQAQVMAMKGTLPPDFGKKNKTPFVATQTEEREEMEK